MSFSVAMRMAQSSFFDRKKVVDEVERANKKNLSKAGAFVRRRARSSIRKRKRVSDPGKPPSSHQGDYRKHIYFGYEPRTQSVVAGPIRFGSGNVPEAVEGGGTSIKVISARRGRPRREIPIKIRKRPAMALALVAERPKFPDIWRDSVG